MSEKYCIATCWYNDQCSLVTSISSKLCHISLHTDLEEYLCGEESVYMKGWIQILQPLRENASLYSSPLSPLSHTRSACLLPCYYLIEGVILLVTWSCLLLKCMPSACSVIMRTGGCLTSVGKRDTSTRSCRLWSVSFSVPNVRIGLPHTRSFLPPAAGKGTL